MCLSKQLQDVWSEHGAETETERNKELVFEAWIRLQNMQTWRLYSASESLRVDVLSALRVADQI